MAVLDTVSDPGGEEDASTIGTVEDGVLHGQMRTGRRLGFVLTLRTITVVVVQDGDGNPVTAFGHRRIVRVVVVVLFFGGGQGSSSNRVSSPASTASLAMLFTSSSRDVVGAVVLGYYYVVGSTTTTTEKSQHTHGDEEDDGERQDETGRGRRFFSLGAPPPLLFLLARHLDLTPPQRLVGTTTGSCRIDSVPSMSQRCRCRRRYVHRSTSLATLRCLLHCTSYLPDYQHAMTNPPDH